MIFRTFSARFLHVIANQGRRASLRSALAPGYHIPRRWRCACPWLSYSAPLALRLPLAIIFRAVGAARLNSDF